MEENIESNKTFENEAPNLLEDSSKTMNENESKLKEENNKGKDLNLVIKEEKEVKKVINSKIDVKQDINSNNKGEIKPKKELPIEKKPFQEFINNHLIPSIKDEFQQRGLVVNQITLKNTYRPITCDKCWVIFCEIKNTCNFWLSFQNDDITSSKSISLSKPNQEASIIESFLIDEKRITLQLIISRILQRLNGQKLIGAN